jgi:hypothetical protein
MTHRPITTAMVPCGATAVKMALRLDREIHERLKAKLAKITGKYVSLNTLINRYLEDRLAWPDACDGCGNAVPSMTRHKPKCGHAAAHLCETCERLWAGCAACGCREELSGPIG